MQHKLIIIVEIRPYLEENSQRVKREFLTELSPLPKTHLKIIDGPPREIINTKEICRVPTGNKNFDGLIEASYVSLFPEENAITILFHDIIPYLTLGKTKVSNIVAEYVKHKWEILP